MLYAVPPLIKSIRSDFTTFTAPQTDEGSDEPTC